jgi:hypothetical protein
MPPWTALTLFHWDAQGMRGGSYTVELQFDKHRIPPMGVTELPYHRFEPNSQNAGDFYFSPQQLGFPNENGYYSGIMTITSYDEKGKTVESRAKNIGIDVEELPAQSVKCPEGQVYDVRIKKCVQEKKD